MLDRKLEQYQASGPKEAVLKSESDLMPDATLTAGSMKTGALLSTHPQMFNPDDAVMMPLEEALSRPPTMEDLPALLIALNKGEISVRIGAAEALGDLGPAAAEAAPALAQLSYRGDSFLSVTSRAPLHKIGPAALPHLSAVIAEPASEDALDAALAAVDISAQDTPLLTSLTPPGLCKGNIGSESPASQCLQSAVMLLIERGLRDPRVNEVLSRLGNRVVPWLLTISNLKDKHVRMGVALALQTIGPDAMPAVLEALEAENKLLRLTALTVLAGVRSTKAIPPMLHSNAAQHEHGRIFPSLINLLKRGSAEERALAADALGRFAPHPPSATDQLRDALKDHRGTVRASAAKALGRIGPAAEEAVPDLVRILEPPLWDRAIRLISGEYAEELAGAAEALGRIGRQAEAAFPVLLRLLKHADDTVKLAAAEALADLDSGRAAPILVDLVKQPESRFVRYAFRRAGKEVVSALITALDDPDPEIQERVLSAMIRLDTAPEAAAPRLLELLESKHYWVRALAGGLLWRLRPEMRKQLEETVLADRRHCYFGDDLSFETHREPRRVLHELAGFIRTTLSSLAEATPQRDPLVSFFISQFADIIREPGEKDNAFHLQNLPLRRSPGLLALRGRTKQLISLLLANSRDIEVAQDTPLIALLVRGWQAEFWRSNGNIEGFEKKIAAAIDQQYIPVPEYFQYFEPATVTVRRKQPRHRGEILAPSQTALNDIADALTAAQMRPPYDKVRESALALLQEMLQAHERGTQLRQAMVGPDRIGSGLRSLRDKIEGAANSTELLGVLLSHDLNKKVLRQFYRGIRAMSIAELCDDIWASKRIRTFLREDLAPEDKIGAALALFADRIEGGLRRHAILKPLNSEKASLRLRQAFGIRGLNEELRRLLKAQSEQSGEAASGQITLKFKPDRGVLAELSGYICDTCWIRQEAIMRRHPNLVFVPFILEDPPRLEGGVASPFLGGAMVMFTRNAANEPVLVIRGLNPHDDLLRHASVQSVCESFIDYLAGVARSLKVTEILIPDDDNSGLTQSNRPQVNGYIKNTYRGHPARYPVTTLPSERKAETLFNDLELGPCIVLRRL